MTTCKEWKKKGFLEEFWNDAHPEDEERKNSKFVDAGGYNWNEREGNWQLGTGRKRRVLKRNKFSLGTESCENIQNLYINKN